MSDAGPSSPVRRAKSEAAFRTIREAADELDLPAHVLRFWESKFPQLRPLKRGGGRRYYRPEDIALLRRIRQCLYQDGYTIRGVQKLLGGAAGDADPREAVAAPTLFTLEAAPPTPVPAPAHSRQRALSPATRTALEEIRGELVAARALLAKLTGGRRT